MDRQIDIKREKKDSKFSISNGNKFPPPPRKGGETKHTNKTFSKISKTFLPKQNNSQHEFPVWIPA